jgi:hypothetical protein
LEGSDIGEASASYTMRCGKKKKVALAKSAGEKLLVDFR